MPEERKLVTILFADIVGSTALGQAHDPEVVRAALGRAFETLREVLVGHGGTVEKFIGDAVMAVFGVPLVHDDDADRAIRSAFALRSRLAELNRTARFPLDLRVGVNSGEVVAGIGGGEQFLVTGSPVNIASRLQAGAAVGEVLVGSLTHQLTAGSIRYGERRDVVAKGIGRLDAWPALELLSVVPEQRHGVGLLAAPLIGRDQELQLLSDAVDRVRAAGTPGLVTIYGPAGAGKSRLTREFINGVQDARVRVGRCLPYGDGVTFYPLQTVVNAECGIALNDDHTTALEKLAYTVDAVSDDPDEARAIVDRVSILVGLAQARDLLPGIPNNELADEMRWGARRFFERRAEMGPLVLVFEDIHWAEAQLLQLIEYLSEWSRAPLLLVCLARADFRDGHPTFGRSAAHATTLSLEPLGSDSTRRLVSELLATEALPESLRADIVTRAEGNPLYVEELLRALIETDRIARRDGRWVAVGDVTEVDVPATLVGLITARLDRMRPEVKRILQRASVIGRSFSTADLEAIGGESVPAGLLREAVDRELLNEAVEPSGGTGRNYRFRHVLVRDVAYATASKSERAQLHDNYSRWLETTRADRKDEVAEIVAFHAERAFVLAYELEVPNADALGGRALTLLLAAATLAHRRSDPVAARKLYDRASVVSDRFPADSVERTEAHGFAGLCGAREDARTPEGDVAFAAAYALASARGPSEVLLHLTMAHAFREYQDDRVEAANDSWNEVVRIGRATGDAELIGTALVNRAFGWEMLGDAARRNATLAEAREHLAATGATRALFGCLGLLVYASLLSSDFTGASRYQEERRACLARQHSKLQDATSARFDAAIAYEIGDLAAALHAAEVMVVAAREAGVRQTVGFGLWYLGDALIDTGDPVRSKSALEEAIAIFEAFGDRARLPEVHAACTRACTRLGDLIAARDHLTTAQHLLLPGNAVATQITGVARAELDEAEGDLAAADAAWRDTLANLPSSGLETRVARTELMYGSFLLRHGRNAEARAQLNAARARYHDPLAYRRVAEIDGLLGNPQSRVTNPPSHAG